MSGNLYPCAKLPLERLHTAPSFRNLFLRTALVVARVTGGAGQRANRQQIRFHPAAFLGYSFTMRSFTETTAKITVSVEPSPLESESKPEEGVYAFAYQISILNDSEDTVQLMERHWVIESAEKQVGEVTGAGVVGVQPVIEPGAGFEYTSSVVIQDPIGSMKGSYVFRRSNGGFFVVQVPRFKLVYLSLFH